MDGHSCGRRACDAVTSEALLWKQLLHSVNVQVFLFVSLNFNMCPFANGFYPTMVIVLAPSAAPASAAQMSENEKLNLIMFSFRDIDTEARTWHISFTLSHQSDLFV